VNIFMYTKKRVMFAGKQKKKAPKQARRTVQSGPRPAKIIKRKSGGGLSPYAQTLVDPWNVYDIKVPDMASFPSTTIHVVEEQTFVNTGGDCIEFTVCPAIAPAQNATDPLAPLKWRMNTVAGGNLPSWTGGANLGCFTWTDYTTLSTKYSGWRCVSAGIQLEYVGTSLTDQGFFLGNVMHPFANYTHAAGPVLVGTIDKSSTTNRFGVRDGLSIVWAPLDNTDLEYRGCGSVCYSNTTDFHGAYAEVPTMIAQARGIAANQVVRARVVANFEVIPGYNTMGASTSAPAVFNPRALNQAKTIFSNLTAFVHPLAETAGQWLTKMKHPVLQGFGAGANIIAQLTA
jgi:hypothetical protein